MPKFVQRLGTDKTYNKPKVTYQEKLSADEIAQKLQGYEKVDDIVDVPLDTHIRYFINQPDGSQLFRTGGFLRNKQNADEWIYLDNGKNSWCVQTKGAVFFKKLSHKDEIDAIHEQYKKKLEERDKIIAKLKNYIRAKKLHP
jgi:hypothetical protein